MLTRKLGLELAAHPSRSPNRASTRFFHPRQTQVFAGQLAICSKQQMRLFLTSSSSCISAGEVKLTPSSPSGSMRPE